MSPAAGALSAALDECAEILTRLTERVDDRLSVSPDGATWGHVGDASRLLGLLREAALAAGADGMPVVASDACPSCGAEELALVSSVPGLALGRVEGGHFEPAGETELDWNGAKIQKRVTGTVLACLACGARWVHPSLAHDVP